MPTVQRVAEAPYTPEQMFDLVNDVERYPQFLSWCRNARVHVRQPTLVEATLDVGVLGLAQSVRTRNSLERPKRIGIDLVAGPFRRLRGEWRFAPTDAGVSISFLLSFDMGLSPLSIVFGKAFEELVGAQVAAFVARAATIYGADSRGTS